MRLRDASPRVADGVDLAVAVELVAAEVAEHEQARPGAGRRRGAARARRLRARRPRARGPTRASARSPTSGWHRSSWSRACDPPPRAMPPGGAVVVVLPLVAETSVTCWPRASSTSASGASAFMTRPLIVAPSPRPVRRDRRPAARPTRDGGARTHGSVRHACRSHQYASTRYGMANIARPAVSGSDARIARISSQHAFLLVGREHRDVADAAEPLDDTLGGQLLDVVERRVVERAEPAVERQCRLRPALVLPPGRALLDPVEDAPDPVDPPDAAIAGVPDQSEASTGSEHAVQLGERRRSASNQWNACATVTASIVAARERKGLGGGRDDGHPGERRPEDVAHALDRLDREQSRAVRREETRQLAGAGREVDDRSARRDPELAGEPGEGGRGVRRPGAFVGLGLRVEPALRDLVHRHVPEMLPDGAGERPGGRRMRASAIRDDRAGERPEGRAQECRPHSSLSLPAHRPARGSSPSETGRVQGQQPIDG